MSRAGGIAHCAEIPPSSADRDGTAGDAVRGKAKMDADRSSEINGGVRFVVSGQRVVNSQHERRDGKNTNPENNGRSNASPSRKEHQVADDGTPGGMVCQRRYKHVAATTSRSVSSQSTQGRRDAAPTAAGDGVATSKRRILRTGRLRGNRTSARVQVCANHVFICRAEQASSGAIKHLRGRTRHIARVHAARWIPAAPSARSC